RLGTHSSLGSLRHRVATRRRSRLAPPDRALRLTRRRPGGLPGVPWRHAGGAQSIAIVRWTTYDRGKRRGVQQREGLMLRTRLPELLGTARPIVLAPMASGATSGHLAAAVCEAGGLGMFGGIHRGGLEWVREQIRFVRSRASGLWGVGFITWWISA